VLSRRKRPRQRRSLDGSTVKGQSRADGASKRVFLTQPVAAEYAERQRRERERWARLNGPVEVRRIGDDDR
jgi:hypothetical protein